MTHPLARELDIAIRLARQAGAAIMAYYKTDLAVDQKHRNEPVTAADRDADEIILRGLRAAFPEDGLLTEESDDDLTRLEKDRVWIVDPLDGTSDFITHTGDFAVQIALARGGHPVLGVVYEPVRDRLMYAVHGQGTYQVCDGETVRLRVSSVSDPGQMCLVASRSHFSPWIEAACQALGIHAIDRMGSVGLKVGRVAQGACDLYLATVISKEWDICAPHALLLEAGGWMTNLCGEPIVYNKADVTECRGLIASNGAAHDRIVDTLAPLIEQAER